MPFKKVEKGSNAQEKVQPVAQGLLQHSTQLQYCLRQHKIQRLLALPTPQNRAGCPRTHVALYAVHGSQQISFSFSLSLLWSRNGVTLGAEHLGRPSDFLLIVSFYDLSILLVAVSCSSPLVSGRKGTVGWITHPQWMVPALGNCHNSALPVCCITGLEIDFSSSGSYCTQVPCLLAA